ncbi:MAG: beta-lactamase family protein [Chitinophagaceae bacterium]|nr:beta-lactamase family protein [Chitinophagaceae bacterium]
MAQLPEFNSIDSVVWKEMADHKIIGLSIGIVKDGSIFYTKGYGTREVRKTAPIDSTTNFLTCSISKLFTASAIMHLNEQGKIDIHKKLIDYVPEFEMKDERYKNITIEQMLTHTSGLPNIFNRHFIRTENDSLALTEFARKLRSKKLRFEPGVQLSEKTYSNTGYDLLGLVIERVTHRAYSNYVRENVLLPAGMDSSSFFYNQISENRRSKPHKKNWLTGRIKTAGYYPDIPQDKPCGNLNSCSYDLCKWMLYNLAIYNETISSNAIVEHSTLMDMWTTRKEIPSFKTSIGLGWWAFQSDQYGKYVFHVGNDPGYSAQLIISPANNFGIVVLCNALYPKDIVWNKLPFEIIDLFNSEWKCTP